LERKGDAYTDGPGSTVDAIHEFSIEFFNEFIIAVNQCLGLGDGIVCGNYVNSILLSQERYAWGRKSGRMSRWHLGDIFQERLPIPSFTTKGLEGCGDETTSGLN
jgi:hypothetical protein